MLAQHSPRARLRAGCRFQSELHKRHELDLAVSKYHDDAVTSARNGVSVAPVVKSYRRPKSSGGTILKINAPL